MRQYGKEQKMVRYILTKSQAEDDENQIREVYGMAITDDTGKIVTKIDNISSDGDAVAELVRICNEKELSPIHFSDVVEDYIVFAN